MLGGLFQKKKCDVCKEMHEGSAPNQAEYKCSSCGRSYCQRCAVASAFTNKLSGSISDVHLSCLACNKALKEI